VRARRPTCPPRIATAPHLPSTTAQRSGRCCLKRRTCRRQTRPAPSPLRSGAPSRAQTAQCARLSRVVERRPTRPPSTVHCRTERSLLQVKKCCPLGDIASAVMRDVCAATFRSSCAARGGPLRCACASASEGRRSTSPVCTRQMRMVVSSAADSSTEASGVTARARTAPASRAIVRDWGHSVCERAARREATRRCADSPLWRRGSTG
jgi:hypothetical protein